MIDYFESSHLYYREDWQEHVSLNDERYWRTPNSEEKEKIIQKYIKDNNEKKKSFVNRLLGKL